MKVAAAIALASVAASAVAQTAAPPTPRATDARVGIALFEARRFDDARGMLAPLAEGAKSGDAEVLFYASRLADAARAEFRETLRLNPRSTRARNALEAP
jgi:hypothetical protein